MPELPLLRLLAPELSQQLGQYLLDSGYTEEGKKGLWDASLPPVSPRTKGLLLELGGTVTPLCTLVRLFELGLSVEASEVRSSLPGWVTKSCLQSGLLREGDGDFSGAFRIHSFRGKLVVYDCFRGARPISDVVAGNSGVASRLLDGTPRTPATTALDVCVGGGIQSLFLADHCERVTGIDLNPRALEIARFNLRLNGVGNVELLHGNRLEPVAGTTFDLIVCNPPFYISPSRRTLYSDNEMELDEFCRRILTEAAGHLDEGGQLLGLAEWVEIEGQTPRERLAEWFDGLGCDVWAMRDYRDDVADYIRKRLIENTPHDRGAVIGWRQYFEQRKVREIQGGAVALRRRQGKNWTFFDSFDRRVTGGRGEHVTQGFAIRDFLSAHTTNDSLLTERFVVSPHARIEEHLTRRKGEWVADFVRLRLAGTVECSVRITNSMARLLRHLDGDRTLEQTMRSSRGLEEGAPIPRLESYLDTTRGLLRRGFVLPRGKRDSDDAANPEGSVD
jgi:methylase of polypeptide subunit release factors